jgi:pyruvate ferredoxin oxidoreductase beta subunit
VNRGTPREIRAVSRRRLIEVPAGLGPGHSACAGCPAPTLLQLAVRVAREAVGVEPVVVMATGCMEVVTTLYPRNAWNVPVLHSAFPNAAAVASGVEAAARARGRRGELPTDRPLKVLVFAGDGGTYDIGLQALSGALERGQDLAFICYNNEGYMNTGVQRSSATPLGAATNTSPVGRLYQGKQEPTKDVTAIAEAHGSPYVAQAAVHDDADLMKKLARAIAVRGPTFVNVLSSCPPGWGIPSEEALEVSRLAAETRIWPLYEVDEGRLHITRRPKDRRPVADYVAAQRRYRHLLDRPATLAALQAHVDERWARLVARDEAGRGG